jgi:cytochrome c-type biogenesis protein CcmE
MKTSHIIILIILIAAIAVVITTVYSGDTYSDFNEAKANPGREVQIIGTRAGTDSTASDSIPALTFSFEMKDDKGTIARVVYEGSKPRDFEKLQQIVIIGKWENDHFRASSLLLKCPSKYKADKPESFGEKTFN